MKIAGRKIETGEKTFIIAELGINHNGDIQIAKKLIQAAKDCGCDAVKFQKRTVNVVYTPEELEKPRENIFGHTNGDLKRGLEFSEEQYRELEAFCKEIDILWSVSTWDVDSVSFMEKFNPPFYKIASACLTDREMIQAIRATGKPVLLSVGMSSVEEIDHCVSLLDKENLAIMSCTSLYPPNYEQIRLNTIITLMERYGLPVGYSGHEADDFLAAVAVGMGACIVERHLTLDRNMWGSDQKASIEPQTMKTLVDRIRIVEAALGDGEISCLPEELPNRDKLRRFQ